MKKYSWYIKVLVVLLISVEVCSAARILAVFATRTASHYAMYGPVMDGLAQRGHEVTLASHFPEKTISENITNISFSDILEIPFMSIEDLHSLSYVDNIYDLIDLNMYTCEGMWKHPKIKEILNTNKTYDIFITELFGTDCFLPIGYKLGIPTIGMISSVPLPWVTSMVANPDNPSYIPLYFSPLTDNMNFLQRLANSVITFYSMLIYEAYSNKPSQELAEKALGPLPPIRDMANNISLILANSHFSINHVRSMVPQLVEVGGLHIPRTIPPLPRDLKEFMDDSEHGVVLFSLGTYVPTDSMPKEKLHAIINVLGSLKQRVLWKINDTGLPPLPPNIKTSNWLPQLAILCHPSTKLFIGHGGLLGAQESTYCGVPMLGVPLFADQYMNIAGLEEKGSVIALNYGDINKETFSKAVYSLINDEKYRKAAQHLSIVFKERPMHPLDSAIYWIEYVIKFGGAKHMRSAAHKLSWYQYYLLDVLVFLLISILVLLFVVCQVLRLVYGIVRNVMKLQYYSEKKEN